MGAVCFALAALLNSSTLLSMAERQPLGSWQRRFALDVTRPLRSLAEWTHLSAPHDAIDEARGRNQGSSDSFNRLGTIVAAPPTGGSAPPGTTKGQTNPSAPTTAAGANGTAAPSPTTVAPTTAPPVSAPVPIRTPTAAAPLKLWVGGDSMAQVFGQELERLAGATGVMTPTLDYRISTGLTRPDYFDWPGHLADVVTSQKPEVMVIMFGANDAQRMDLGGQIYDVGDAQWQAEYRRRVAAVMDFLARDGRRVIWVGQPVMRSADFTVKMQILDGIYRDEAAKHPGVTFVDTWGLFADASGRYSAYLPDGSGEPKLMRQQDGIHLSLPGGDRLAKVVLTELQKEMAPATP